MNDQEGRGVFLVAILTHGNECTTSGDKWEGPACALGADIGEEGSRSRRGGASSRVWGEGSV